MVGVPDVGILHPDHVRNAVGVDREHRFGTGRAIADEFRGEQFDAGPISGTVQGEFGVRGIECAILVHVEVDFRSRHEVVAVVHERQRESAL